MKRHGFVILSWASRRGKKSPFTAEQVLQLAKCKQIFFPVRTSEKGSPWRTRIRVYLISSFKRESPDPCVDLRSTSNRARICRRQGEAAFSSSFISTLTRPTDKRLAVSFSLRLVIYVLRNCSQIRTSQITIGPADKWTMFSKERFSKRQVKLLTTPLYKN